MMWANFNRLSRFYPPITPFTRIARYYEGQGLYNQAALWYKQCLSMTSDRLGEEHPSVATSLNNLAGLYLFQGRYEEAEAHQLQAIAILVSRLGIEHPSPQTLWRNFVGCLQSAVAAGQKDRLSSHPTIQQLLAQFEA